MEALARERHLFMTVNFKEGWETATLKCVMCKKSEKVKYDPERRKRHMRGELVQDVWIEATNAYRSQMIGLRSGIYICDDCFPKEEE